ncbi:hypothetical protein K0M31_004010 [Melipona bicolor]|uniref:Uncharacterized protein n=1 Tax=Melipona bicolor TaxID=60889 RepID=A0AA40FY04_9HYME|nr:hypothetical protein K0M31_004010 [Melipona bicolor]
MTAIAKKQARQRQYSTYFTACCLLLLQANASRICCHSSKRRLERQKNRGELEGNNNPERKRKPLVPSDTRNRLTQPVPRIISSISAEQQGSRYAKAEPRSLARARQP